MRHPLHAIAPSFTLLLLAAAAPAQDRAPAPAELFRARCAECHVRPDPAVKTDEAWIHQLQETA